MRVNTTLQLVVLDELKHGPGSAGEIAQALGKETDNMRKVLVTLYERGQVGIAEYRWVTRCAKSVQRKGRIYLLPEHTKAWRGTLKEV